MPHCSRRAAACMHIRSEVDKIPCVVPEKLYDDAQGNKEKLVRSVNGRQEIMNKEKITRK